ncbi:hypothetical protein F442_18298 [Phytophthora nicotianae P10297]|uniref:Uncharacterized protein n=1 Tax=Phytophthora nicotianae P10297 TaxID=1317064 RepID=W2YDG4_PHYNI|nr:hypothetical protein F442_18298 [Phytophthora nicotianae P10297]
MLSLRSTNFEMTSPVTSYELHRCPSTVKHASWLMHWMFRQRVTWACYGMTLYWTLRIL